MAIVIHPIKVTRHGRLTPALAAVLAAGLLLVAPTTSRAVPRTWTGAFNSDWYNGSNWLPLGGPFEDDQLSVFGGTIAGSRSPVVRDGGSILLSGSSTTVSFPALWFLNVGQTGTGTVTVRNGADLTSFNVTMVGDEAGSDGDLFIQGSGSTLTTDRLSVGVDGLGLMEITGGAHVTSEEGVIALNSSASGSRALVSGNGSTWDLGTSPLRTSAGLGYLDVQAGGAVFSGEGRIGVNGGRGEVTVTGESSRWVMSESIDVGLYGAGSLSVANGGLVSATDLGVHALTFLGYSASLITVDGNNSRLEIENTMNVGKGFDISNTGPASLTVRNGGVVRTGGTLTIFGQGTVKVESGGSLFTDVLDRTVGTLNTSAGSQLYANQLVGFSGNTVIGGSLNLGHSGGVGSFSVGAGELLFVNRGLVVGLDNGSQAQVTASGGGRIDTGIASIAAFPGSVGEVVVNTGSQWANVDTIQIGLFGAGTLEVAGGSVQTAWLVLGQEGGQGTVNVSGAGSVSVGETLSVGAASNFNLVDGTLRAGGVTVSSGGQFNFMGGTLTFDSFVGELTQNGGVLAAGDSAGATAITGDYHLQGGALQVELAGLVQGDEYDFYDVMGDVTLAGGSLDVALLAPFTLDIDQQFDILRVDGSLSGTFDGLAEGALVGNFGGTDLFVTYQAGDGNDVALVTTAPLAAGDYNGDGAIDAADYVMWRKQDGTPAGYQSWRSSFGAAAGRASVTNSTVPEPASLGLLMVAAIAGSCRGVRFSGALCATALRRRAGCGRAGLAPAH